MTLATLSGQLFSARIGASVTVEAADGELPLEVLGVKENPLGSGPGATRIPFSVLLRGPESPCLLDGCYGIRDAAREDAEALRLEGVFLNRVLPPAGTDGRGAFYQIIFA